MRVVAGSARGHKLRTLEGKEIRPTADRVKEAIFSSLGRQLDQVAFLDLFSGTGAMGIEALSRGVHHACFLEADYKHGEIIKENLEHVKKALMHDKYNIMITDVVNGLSKLSSKEEKFNIIFMDPPYGSGLSEKAIKLIFDRKLLAEDGILVVEKAIDEAAPDFDFIDVFKTKIYGKTAIYFIKF